MTKEKKNKHAYFNKDTQKAIYDFLNSNDKTEKEKLYINYIMPSFDKLVENLININKFSSFDENYEDLKNDCITFLFESLNKFDFDRGTNAFSYFNVVAKNWLIIKSKQKQIRIKNTVSLDEDENDNGNSNNDSMYLESNLIIYQDKLDKESNEERNRLIETLMIVKSMAKTKNEINCINSILSIFENVDNIDLLNKNAIFLYLREISGLNPKQLTLTIQTLKKYYKKINLKNNSEI